MASASPQTRGRGTFPVGTFFLGAALLSLPWMASLVRSQDVDEMLLLTFFLWFALSFVGTMGVIPTAGDERGLSPGLRWRARAAGAGAALLSLLSPWLAARPRVGQWSMLLQAWALPLWAYYLWNEAPERRPLAWLARKRRDARSQLKESLQPRLQPESMSFEARVPEPAAPEAAPDPDTPVETGVFRVDAARALDKLRRYRMEDPYAFLLPWLRLAVVSGASSISAGRTPRGLSLRFDGEPLSAAAMKDPYTCLFGAETSDEARSLYLAQGLLGAMLHRPGLVRVSSGKGEGRACLLAGPLSSGDRRGPASGQETVIEVELGGWLPGWKARRILSRAGPLFPSRPVRLSVDSEKVPEDGFSSHSPGSVLLEDSGPGVRVLMKRMGPSWGTMPGRLRLFKHGVFVGEAEDARLQGCHALVNDDSFTLDLSGAKVVRDERWDAAMDRLSRLRAKEDFAS